MDNFERAFNFTVGVEGAEWDTTYSDSGNWTGGVVGVGELKGSKFGISAASYPKLDIKNLTLADAENIYRIDYWEKVLGDSLPLNLALVVFDAAVNNGVGRAIRWLQAAVGASVDGRIGPATLATALKTPENVAIAEFMAQRLFFMGGLKNWQINGLGWSRRLVKLTMFVGV